MHHSENTKIKLITMIKKERYSWLDQQTMPVRVKRKPLFEPWRAKPKTKHHITETSPCKTDSKVCA